MTVVAALELAEQFFAVRRFMAILARGNHAVLVCMTEHAQELGMLCRTGFKGCLDVSVTGAAILVFDLLGKCQGQRLMRLVAGYAVLEFLSLDMRIMAVKAVGPESMLLMTEGA